MNHFKNIEFPNTTDFIRTPYTQGIVRAKRSEKRVRIPGKVQTIQRDPALSSRRGGKCFKARGKQALNEHFLLGIGIFILHTGQEYEFSIGIGQYDLFQES